MKMAVVGCEASGKTVFMCALADYYGRSAVETARLRLTPENAAANNFERYQFRQMRCLRQWPPATPPNRTLELKWSLRKSGEPMAEIDLLEFGGETYRAAFRDNGKNSKAPTDAAVGELIGYLSSADFFVVLVSLKALLADPGKANDEDFERETEALWVTRGILEFIRSHRPQAGVVIGLTQADRYRNEICEAGGAAALFASRWPTVAAAAQGCSVVEVASVSKTDENGNPASDYRTNGILPVMQAFSSHCFGNPNALESGESLKSAKRHRASGGGHLALWLVIIAAVFAALASLVVFNPKRFVTESANCAGADAAAMPSVVTNEVERLVEKTVTNEVPVIVFKAVTNTVEHLVERPVTNTVEVERIVAVTNTVEVERLVAAPVVTNTVEVKVERVVTNTVETVVAAPSDGAANSHETQFRPWTDSHGNTIAARWLEVSEDRTRVTIVSKRTGRSFNASLKKFSLSDRAYIKGELVRHDELGETLVNGRWVKNKK